MKTFGKSISCPDQHNVIHYIKKKREGITTGMRGDIFFLPADLLYNLIMNLYSYIIKRRAG